MGAIGVAGAALLAAAATAVLLLRADDERLRSALPARYGDDGERGSSRGPGGGGGHAGGPSGAREAGGPWRAGRATRRRHASSWHGGPPSGRASAPARADPAQPPRRWSTSTLACVLAGLGVVALLPLPVGPVAGLTVALAGPRLLDRLEPREVRSRREQLVRDLPLVLDLLAACLAGGAPLTAAAAAVGQAVRGPAGDRLAAVGAALQVGAPPGEAWAALAGPDVTARDDDPLGPAARALARAADGGAPVASAVARLAADARADARSRAEQAARRVGVLAVAPLGLCFLPAFVLLGIVPLVLSLAGPLLAGA